jgi:tetratricopeptide (TPR) repeat protein
LRVASRTSSFLFKGSDQDIRTIGEKLKVKTILEGSVRKSGERLRVTVQLINVADGYHLWSHRYDSDLKDVFEIQDEIAENAARMLEPLLRTGVRKARRTGMEAYDYYLRGRKLYELRAKGLELAREMFERSAECDPDYALAYTGIADCSAWLYLWFTGDSADLRKADEASRRAVELSGDLAEAHVSRGLALWVGKRYEDAAAEYEKAIKLNPNLFDAWYFYGRARFTQNRAQDALRLSLRASEIQPDDYQSILIAVMAYQKIGEHEKELAARQELLRRVERRLIIDPHDARAMYIGAESLVVTGGDEKRADEWIQRALAEDPEDQVALYSASCYYSVKRDKDKALELLDKLTSGRHGVFRDWVDNDPDFDFIRSDPRFQEVMSRLR